MLGTLRPPSYSPPPAKRVESSQAPASTTGKRHSSFEPSQLRSVSEPGRVPSPATATAAQDRQTNVSNLPKSESSKDGLFSNMFGRKKSKSDEPSKPKPGSSYRRNSVFSRILNNDPRARAFSRRHSTATAKSSEHKANTESVLHPPYLTSRELGARHPHSGPAATHGMPMLETIVSAAEVTPREEQPDPLEAVQAPREAEEGQGEIVNQPIPEGDEPPVASDLPPKSAQELEFRPAAERQRKRSSFGGFFRNEAGIWSRGRRTSAD